MYDVVIVGAGPIGLFLANLLGESKINVLVIEKVQSEKAWSSKAIGVTPPSLELMAKIGLDQQFLQQGVPVRHVTVHGSQKLLGEVNFDHLNSAYPYILSIPQNETETILKANLNEHQSITFSAGHELINFKERDGGHLIELNVKDHLNHTEKIIQTKYLCACDGSKSTVRRLLDLPFPGGKYSETFLMGDFIDQTGFGYEAHLFFTSKGSVESFPLPEGKRRWIINTEQYLKTTETCFLTEQVLKRTGIDIRESRQLNQNPFGVQHHLLKELYHHNIIFCGDSAHVMSPIGGQGMNTGFADAEFASYIINHAVINRQMDTGLLRKYNHYRRKAAKSAIKRAKVSMKIGTIKNVVPSFFRNLIISLLLPLFKNWVPVQFSMINIPYGTVKKVERKIRLFFEYQ